MLIGLNSGRGTKNPLSPLFLPPTSIFNPSQGEFLLLPKLYEADQLDLMVAFVMKQMGFVMRIHSQRTTLTGSRYKAFSACLSDRLPVAF
jgi:hypothetical protein